ncbi:MAG TPA: ABC transporter permease [Thermoplasmata archaeon]|jgi:ABC-type multidrug transport system permease subunit|nr:ABC transporter permease [Thermoplasmata archaeon]
MATIRSEFPNVPQNGRALPAFLIVGWRWISRNPAVAITPILLPFIFLYFLSLISPPSALPLEIVGAMMFTMQNIGSWVLGDSAYWRIEHSLQDMFVASPLSRVRYLFGIAFSNLIAMLPALAILAVLLAWAGAREGTPLTPGAFVVLVASLAVLWVLFSSVGIGISSRIRTQREIWPVGNLTFTILGMLTPLYYPLKALPPLWQDAARFLPATYAALLVQGALGITPATPAQMAFYAVLLVAAALVGLVIMLRLYRWGEA